jgi:hypothetical protein
MTGAVRWQTWVMAALGFVLFITPFAFGSISNTDPAAWTAAASTAWVGGLLLLLFSAESVFTVFDRWIELLPLIEGILTIGISGSALLGGRANRRSARA